jgi:hypothetical protein
VQTFFAAWLWSDGLAALSATEFCTFLILALGTFDGALVAFLHWIERRMIGGPC